MSSQPLRPAFLAAAFAAALATTWCLVFVLSKKDFWAELNLFLTLVAAGYFVILWAFLFFGWGLRQGSTGAPELSPRWSDRFRWLDVLQHVPWANLDFGGDELVGSLLALLASLLATLVVFALLVVAWGVIELVVVLLAMLAFVAVNHGFRAQVVLNRRARGRPFRSVVLALYFTALTVGWLPLVIFAYRLWLL